MNLIPVAFAATTETPVVPTFLSNIAVGFFVIIASFVIAGVLRNWAQRVIRAKQGEGHEEAQILYGRMVFSVTLIVGITTGLILMGVPLEWFSGGIGLGVAFALKSFISNFFAGVVLLLNKKFNLGDFVIVDPDASGNSSIVGRIVDIQARTTSVRAIDGGEITVPNLKMIDSAVKCYTKNPIRRHTVSMSIGYGVDIDAASEVMRKVVTAHANVQPEPKVVVLISNVGDSDIVLEARFWTESTTKWWMVKSELTRDVFKAFVAAGFDIPYPIQTLRVDDDSSELLAKDARFLAKLEQIEIEKTAKKPNSAPQDSTPIQNQVPTPPAPVAGREIFTSTLQNS